VSQWQYTDFENTDSFDLESNTTQSRNISHIKQSYLTIYSFV